MNVTKGPVYVYDTQIKITIPVQKDSHTLSREPMLYKMFISKGEKVEIQFRLKKKLERKKKKKGVPINTE